MSEKKIAVSVISPIYNTPEKMLRNNIEHLISQTLKNIEIILVDDGSKKETANICDEYAKEDDRIAVIHQKNKGLCGARNSGQKAAKGEYISFVDGDDFLEYDALENLYKETEGNKVDIVFSKVVKDFNGNLKEYNFEKVNKRKCYDAEGCKYLQREVLDFSANISSTGNKLYKRTFLERNKLYHDEELGQGAEGIEYLIRVFGDAKSAIFVNKITYHYVYNGQSITETHDEKNHTKVLDCFSRIEDTIKNQHNYESLHEELLVRIQYSLITMAISGYFSSSNKSSYQDKKEDYEKLINGYLLAKEALKSSTKCLDLKRRFILFCIKNHFYIPVSFLAFLRKKQKRIENEK